MQGRERERGKTGVKERKGKEHTQIKETQIRGGPDETCGGGAMVFPLCKLFLLLLTRSKLFFLLGKRTSNFSPIYPHFSANLWINIFFFTVLLNRQFFSPVCTNNLPSPPQKNHSSPHVSSDPPLRIKEPMAGVWPVFDGRTCLQESNPVN